MKSLCRILPFLLLSVILSGTGVAAVLTGQVVDRETDTPLANANIEILNRGLGAAADGSGSFRIDEIPDGQIRLRVTRVGYKPVVRTITIDGKKTVLFQLEQSVFRTDRIVVTATRSNRLLENVPIQTELVTAQEIERRGAETLADALDDRPGVMIEANSSGGKVLRLNGFDSRHVLILKDGLPIAGRLNNRLEADLLDADQIQQVEILKGPASSLYGSEAMGGVINIITQGYSNVFQVDATARTGSDDLYSGSLSLRGQVKDVGYIFNADHRTGGVDKNESTIDVTDRQASRFSGRLQLPDSPLGQFSVGTTLKTDELDTESASMMGGLDLNTTEVRRIRSHVDWNRGFGAVQARVRGYVSDYRRMYSNTPERWPHATSIDTTRERMSGFRSDVSLPVRPGLHLDFGYDYSHDVYRSDRVRGYEMSRDEHGFFLQSEIQPWQRLTVLLGGRYDTFSTIDNYFSPRVSALYTLASDLKLRGSWGGGFRAPSFLDMYIDYQNPYITVIGNPDLDPESSTGYSMGMDWTYGDRVQTTLNVSRSKVENLITDVVIGRQMLSYDNVEEATFTSMEWQSRVYITRNLNFLLGYNYTDIDHSDSELVSSVTPHAATIRTNWAIWDHKLNLSVRQQLFSARDVNVFDTQLGDYRLDRKKGYGLLDITLTAKLHRLLTARVGLTNALDFVDKEFGPWIGRRFFLGLNSRFPSI